MADPELAAIPLTKIRAFQYTNYKDLPKCLDSDKKIVFAIEAVELSKFL